jgi:hypothetical protein
MSTNEKVLNIKSLYIIEKNNFDFWATFIRGHMEPVALKEGQEQGLKESCRINPTKYPKFA